MSERDIFLALLDLPDSVERAKYLDEACSGDAALRARVEKLIRSHESAGSFLDLSADPTRAFATPDDAPTHTQGELPDDDTDDALGFLAPAQRPGSLGRIGHYEVLEVLGRGGFGIVFRAFDDVLQRVVAVKVLAPSMAATSPARKRFLREARSAALVQHENVVRIHETGEEPLPYLVMEFVPGDTLQQRLDRTGPLEVAESLKIARQIAAGLDAAHEKGLIHRDIKPSNILIDSGPQQQVKITDFGLARAADDASLTRSGVVAGTPMYMAPEQAKGETLDRRADLFSLGSVLYAMLTGRPPFRAANTPAVLKRVAEDDPRPMREVIPEIPEWLCRIVEKLHAKNAEERFQTAKEVAELLADCEKQLEVHQELTDFARIPGGRPKPPRQRSGRRLQWVAAAVVVLAGLYVWFGRSAALYLSDQGELTFLPEEGLVSVIVLQNDEGDLFTDKAHTSVTDWLGMKEKQSLTLPPGRYQVNVSTYPLGTNVDQWEVTTSGPFGSSQLTVPVIRTSAIVTVGRGQRVTLRAKMRTDPPRPEPPTPQPSDGFVSLFNGTDLTGWKPHTNEPGSWHVVGGVLVGTGTERYLFSERGDYRDFHLRVEAKITDKGNSGVHFRSAFGPKIPDGYEAQINLGTDPWETGSLLLLPWKQDASILHHVKERLIQPDKWFTLDVLAQGPRIIIKVDGLTVTDLNDSRYQTGHLALQAGRLKTEIVQFRKIEIKELPASPSADGFVPLFNGKTLTGWKSHPDQPGKWTVKGGAIVGSGAWGRLFSERGDFQDFHLRIEARVNEGGNSGVYFRIPYGLSRQADVNPHGYEAQIYHGPTQPGGADAVLTGSLFQLAPFRERLVPPNEWFTYEIIAQGNVLTLKVNGKTTVRYTDEKRSYTRGHIALQQYGPNTVVQFRKIEVKELPASAPEVPRRTADVLPFIQGTWKFERVIVEPKLPPEKARLVGQLTFDTVAGGTVARGLHVDQDGKSIVLILHSYDAKADRLKSWSFSAEDGATASNFGVYDAASRSFLWEEPLTNGVHSLHHMDFVDANTVRSRIYDRDAAGTTVYESHATFTRTNEPAATLKPYTDPKRPEEMKVLDRLVGEWRHSVTLKDAAAPDKPKTETVRVSARSILGGRFIEVIEANETTNTSDYTLVWFDAAAKRYRQSLFSHGGYVIEFTGTWDEAAKTMSWTTADKRLEGRWTFPGDDRREFQHLMKDKDGKTLNEAAGESRRLGSPAKR